MLYHPTKKYLGFPITVATPDLRKSSIGSVDFQGAYFYQISPKYELKKKGQISHVTKELTFGGYNYNISGMV